MEKKSNFGSNLILQLIICGVLYTLSAVLPYHFKPFKNVIQTIAAVFSSSFYIGLVYGLFRMGGLKITPLEWYFQNIPYGWKMDTEYDLGGSSSSEMAKEDPSSSLSIKYPEPEVEKFNWDSLLSVEYLRYAGALLMFTAASSLLFKIEWPLISKIVAAFGFSIITLIGAEVLRAKNKLRMADISFLASFSLFQFGLTLLFLYFPEQDPKEAGTSWMIIKTIVSLVFSVGLFRYSYRSTAAVFLLIAYLTPVSLVSVGAVVSLDLVIALIGALSVLSLVSSTTKKSELQTIVNSICAFSAMFAMYLNHAEHFTKLANLTQGISGEVLGIKILITSSSLIIFYLVKILYSQLNETISSEVVTSKRLSTFDYLLSQALFTILTLTAVSDIPSIKDYLGASLLVLATPSLLACLYLRSKQISNILTEVMLNFSLLLSAVGMLVQTRGPWSAVVFLIFSCLAIYFAIRLGTLRTRVYAFVVLTISLWKLYTECYSLFDSLSGSSVILVIGFVLVLLSFKLEKIKELVSNSTHGES